MDRNEKKRIEVANRFQERRKHLQRKLEIRQIVETIKFHENKIVEEDNALKDVIAKPLTGEERSKLENSLITRKQSIEKFRLSLIFIKEDLMNSFSSKANKVKELEENIKENNDKVNNFYEKIKG